jgi:hypothetical protein
MAASPYDLDGDGTCDAPTCKDLTAAGLACGPGIFGASLPTGKIVRRDLAKIGVTFGPDPECGALPPALDPTTHIPITADLWGPDYPDAGQFLQQLFSQSGKGTSPTALPQYRYSLVGASPEQLQAWGYRVQQVPSVDDQIDRCASLAFGARVTCWADLDRYLMTKVVPWVPLMHEENNWIVSSRVAAFSEDETGMPALDRIALEPGAM